MFDKSNELIRELSELIEETEESAGTPETEQEHASEKSEHEHSRKADEGEGDQKSKKSLYVNDKSKSRPPKKKRAGRTAAVILSLLIVCAIGLCVVVAEPWIDADADNYTFPTPQAVPTIIMAVGDSYKINPKLGDNEQVTSVEITDTDILALDKDSVVAKGQYFYTTVTVTTMEIKVPEEEMRYPGKKLFGVDIAKPYDKLRTFLRTLIGKESDAEPRSELRVLNIYEYSFTVDGLADVTERGENITAYIGESGVVPAATRAGEELSIDVSDRTKVDFSVNDKGETVFTAKAAGETEIVQTFGFFKTVEESVYAQYKKAQGSKDGEAAAADASGYRIFVPQRSVAYSVIVAAADDVELPKSTENGATHVFGDIHRKLFAAEEAQ